MASFIDKLKAGAHADVDWFYNPANGSSARKFSTSDSIVNPISATPATNSEHTVTLASGIKSLSVITSLIARVARENISSVRDELAGVGGQVSPNERQNVVKIDDVEIDTLRNDLVSSISPVFDNIGDDSRTREMQDRLRDSVDAAEDSVLPRRGDVPTEKLVNDSVPELESVELEMSNKKGSVDSFFARLTVNLPAAKAKKVKALRFFRADWNDPVRTRPLFPLSSIAMDRLRSYANSRKGGEGTSIFQTRLDESGVINAVSQLNPVNPLTNIRTSANDAQITIPPPLRGKQYVGDPSLPESFSHLDQSVTQNVMLLANMQQDPRLQIGIDPDLGSIVVGRGSNPGLRLNPGQRDQIERGNPKTDKVVEQNNGMEFQEIALIGVERFKQTRIGNTVEYTYEDGAIMYGRGYRYFVCTVDAEMRQSTRSNMASLVVEGVRVPERPSSLVVSPSQISVSLAISVSDQLVEKFEIYRRDEDVNSIKKKMASTVSDMRGFTTSLKERTVGDNGYLLIGETPNPAKGGASFSDSDVKPGGSYTYRVYSVDVFGNKSESPTIGQAYVPDLDERTVDLRKPTLLVERDSSTEKARVTFACDDPLVARIILQRRDLTIGQESFSTPDSPPRLIFGLGTVLRRRRFLGEVLTAGNPGETWNGSFVNRLEPIVFIDQTAALDHIYQYRVYGLDVYGNRTSYEVSRPVLMIRRPFIDAPINLTSSLVTGSDGSVKGVTVSWDEANSQYAAEELIGSQAALEDTRTRTLYQIERKKSGEETWRRFSLITETSITDTVTGVSGTTAPVSRPPFLTVNSSYEYRVQAIQTGAFISNFTSPVSIFVGYEVSPPTFFTIKTPATTVKPFYVMLNWDTDALSGIVDRWEIERADVNNIAAARLNFQNPADFQGLKYKKFRTVYREASRFLGQEQDNYAHDNELRFNILISSGQHYYQDTMVEMGNSYFYRIRAIAPSGKFSPWVYKGIKLTSTSFERKWLPIISTEERLELSNQQSPMQISKPVTKSPNNSAGIQPNYSRPLSIRSSPRINPRIIIPQEE